MTHVVTLDKTRHVELTSLATKNLSIGELLAKEWLLTNRRGSYIASTVACCNTLSYHGLLVGSLTPPTNRVVALSQCLEQIVMDDVTVNLATFQFGEEVENDSLRYLNRFSQDIGVHFEYGFDKCDMTKSIYLAPDSDTVACTYAFHRLDTAVDLTLKPFVAIRGFHELQDARAPLENQPHERGQLILYPDQEQERGQLLLSCPEAEFVSDPKWWFNFTYEKNRQRGQAASEDLWSPGSYRYRLTEPTTLVFWATFGREISRKSGKHMDLVRLLEELTTHQEQTLKTAKPASDTELTLCLAADQFVVNRAGSKSDQATILAGYPWFADWGRDAFISLPGLLLVNNRFGEAKSVLTTFAEVVDRGMVPNRFDDRENITHFNSIDASLWFVNAAFQYLRASDDAETFDKKLLPVIRCIVDAYLHGTRYDIRADEDDLITGGDCDTQLTWMDAKCDGVAFTPRHGKAVEINALWYNAISALANYFAGRSRQAARHYESWAERIGNSFCALFWNEETGHLNDTIYPDGVMDASLRPNQVLALALPFTPPLSYRQQLSILTAVETHLLTPYGLRTLSPLDVAYRGRYQGPQWDRDGAYHQGTVWPYLIGGFVDAYLKVHGPNETTKREAYKFIAPLISHISQEGCLGSVAEIFDGDEPQQPKGCFAQAWSVAELLRSYDRVKASLST